MSLLSAPSFSPSAPAFHFHVLVVGGGGGGGSVDGAGRVGFGTSVGS